MNFESTVVVNETTIEKLFSADGVSARVRRIDGEWLLTLPDDPALAGAGSVRAYESPEDACDAARRIVQACSTAREMRAEADRAVATAFHEAAGNPRYSVSAEELPS